MFQVLYQTTRPEDRRPRSSSTEICTFCVKLEQYYLRDQLSTNSVQTWIIFISQGRTGISDPGGARKIECNRKQHES